jgi:hypothetical protein
MNAIHRSVGLGLAAAGMILPGKGGATAAAPVGRYQIHHEATIQDIPTGAKKARIWLVVPREDRAQTVGEIRLTGPGKPSVH